MGVQAWTQAAAIDPHAVVKHVQIAGGKAIAKQVTAAEHVQRTKPRHPKRQVEHDNGPVPT